MLNLLKFELFSRWKTILGWGIGLSAFISLYIVIFPQFEDQMGVLADIPVYQMFGIDLGSMAGWLASIAVQYTPLLLAIYVVAVSTGTLGGEEDSGTLELIMAMPLKRWQIFSMKALAIAIAIFIIIVFVSVFSTLTLEFVKATYDTEVDVTTSQLIIAVLNSFPISLATAMIGMMTAAYLPKRRLAVVVTGVFFVASYFAYSIFNMIENFEAFKAFSIFNYFDSTAEVFTTGPQIGDVAVLLGVALICFALGLWSFQRRDVTVHKWPWQRAPQSARA